MKKQFYSHLITIETIHSELNELSLAQNEQEELITIIHTTIHHVVLDTVLSELSEEDKKIFLTHLSHEDYERLWHHLRDTIEDVEDKIKQAAAEHLKIFRSDIQELKKK